MRHQRRGTSGPGAQQLPEAEDFQGELSIGGSQDDESCSGGQLTEETRVREMRARRRRVLQAGEGPALSHNALLCVANKGFRNANCDLWTLCSGCSGRQEAPRIRTGTLSVWSRSASMQDVPEEWREERGGDGRTGGPEGKKKKKKGEESLMMELTRLVQEAVEGSSWWERRGIDCSILAAAFLCLPPAFLLLGSSQVLLFSAGMLLMGAAHAVIAFKGTHLASHGALSESQAWGNFWAVFFIEVCGSFSARVGVQGHIKMHHAHTNVVGLGDSSVWKVPCLPRAVYLFVAPLAVPVITPLVALAHLRGHPVAHVVRTVLMVALGLYSQYWLLIHVSGFLSPLSALLCMLACRAMFSVPYIHVNIFQHIGLHMFAPTSRPKRIYQMTHGVLNLPRNALLDWMCGHSLISCHVEHHLFPFLSDNMCLKVKPLVSKYLMEKQLPYQEDGYFSRLAMFFHKYQELMVFAPPITELVGVQ